MNIFKIQSNGNRIMQSQMGSGMALKTLVESSAVGSINYRT